jgi:hypothetical protein
MRPKRDIPSCPGRVVFVLTCTPPVCQVSFGEQSSIAVLHPPCSRSCRSWPLWNSPTGPYLKDEVLASVQTPGLTRRGSTCLAMVHLCNRCVTSVLSFFGCPYS